MIEIPIFAVIWGVIGGSTGLAIFKVFDPDGIDDRKSATIASLMSFLLLLALRSVLIKSAPVLVGNLFYLGCAATWTFWILAVFTSDAHVDRLRDVLTKPVLTDADKSKEK